MAAGMIGLSGCGMLAEEAVEKGIESGSGGDVEFDMNGEDGNFSVQTEDGEFSMQTDEDGNVTMSGSDANGEEFEINADQSGNITGGNEDDSFSMQTDEETGSFKMETEDGTMESAAKIPDDFPDSIPLPSDFEVQQGTRMESEGAVTWSVSGATGQAVDEVIETFGAAVSDAGYAEVSSMSSAEYAQVSFEGEYTVSMAAFAGDGVTNIQLTVMPVSS